MKNFITKFGVGVVIGLVLQMVMDLFRQWDQRQYLYSRVIEVLLLHGGIREHFQYITEMTGVDSSSVIAQADANAMKTILYLVDREMPVELKLRMFWAYLAYADYMNDLITNIYVGVMVRSDQLE